MKRVQAFLLLCSGIAIGFLGGTMITTGYADQIKFNYDQIVGRIGETTITRGELAEKAMLTENAKGTLGMALLTSDLQDSALVEEAARRAGVTVTADEIAQRMREARSFAEQSFQKNMFEKIPKEVLEAENRRMLLIEKLTGLTVTEDEAKDFYRASPGFFTIPAMVKLICIETTNRADALSVVKLLDEGRDPKKLSAQYSASEDLKQMQGDIGWRVRTSLSPDVASAIFEGKNGAGLKPGDSTGIITVKVPDAEKANVWQTRYYVFFVDDINQQQMRKYEEVRNASFFGARTVKYSKVSADWFKSQGVALGKEWQQVENIRDPQAALVPAPVTADKYNKQTSEKISPSLAE